MNSTSATEFDADATAALRSRAGEYLEGAHDGRGLRVGLVCSRFNGAITTRLLTSALESLAECGVDRGDISIAWVPGAFEIPLLALAYADATRPYDAVIALGAVIRGDTSHYEIVSGECARGVQDCSSAPGCRWYSACSPPSRSTRRWSARCLITRTRDERRR